MNIHVAKDGQQFGPYPLAELEQLVRSGTFRVTDLCWHEGIADWQPISSLVTFATGNVPPPMPVSVPPPVLPATPAVNSRLAVWSLVLGILAFIFLIPFLPAIICGHLALGRIKRSDGALTGRGMAIAGLVMGYFFVAIFMLGIMAGIAFPVISKVQENARLTQDLGNAKHIGLACKLWAQDHNGHFPPNLEVLVPEYLPNHSVLTSAFATDKSEVSYEYTPGLTESSPGDTVLLRDKYTRSHKEIIVRVDMSGAVRRIQ
ncbi:MAG: DUF4190 domain-containing protein [Chthoniobacterales bacterium]